jgi:hypothetical protein
MQHSEENCETAKLMICLEISQLAARFPGRFNGGTRGNMALGCG